MAERQPLRSVIRPAEVEVEVEKKEVEQQKAKPCAACKRKDKEIAALEEKVERLTRAVQRESVHYEERKVHGRGNMYKRER